MSCVRRPYFEDGGQTIHFSQRGQIEFDPRTVNHCLIIKEKERDWRGGAPRDKSVKKGNGRLETVLENRKEWNKTGKNCEKE